MRLRIATLLACACTSDPEGHAATDSTDDGTGTSAASTSAATHTDTTAAAESETVADDGSTSQAGSETGPVGCELTDATELALDSGMALRHRDGQTFVVWHDRAEGPGGEATRYRVYRSPMPIASDDDLVALAPVADGILNHSGQLFGSAFTPAQRLDATLPMAVLDDLGEPLPPWSGLWVTTAELDACAYYAVIATDLAGIPIESVAVGVNATADPIAERVGERAPIEVYASSDRGKYSPQTEITGATALPLHVLLHASNAQGGGAGDYGDYWLYFGDASMGWQSGLPGVFSVEETHSGPQYLMMRNRDTIVAPEGNAGVETMWFGYVAELAGERFAYPFTEARLSWMVPWVIARYEADPERVYASGGSMGAWGSMSYAFRRPELFAAVFPDRPRMRQTTLTSVTGEPSADDTLPDGTPWSQHHDAVAFASAHPEDLPFVGWNIGRQDGFASWAEQIDMIAAMTASHHGFAFAWNDGDHSSGSDAAAMIAMWYPAERFARNLGYPAFGHSSIDDDAGSGDPTQGDLVGGVNLGFVWSDPVDEPDHWSCEIGNALASASMTVDVTPRRSQQFVRAPGDAVAYTTSAGQSGELVADEHGLVTLPQMTIPLGATVTVTLDAM